MPRTGTHEHGIATNTLFAPRTQHRRDQAQAAARKLEPVD
jgi:hypothetical protein